MENESKSIMSEAWEWHDAIKGHPYWLSGDDGLLPSLLDMFYDLTGFIWDEDFRRAIDCGRNPYYAAIAESHDVRGLRNAMRWHDGMRYDKAKLIQALQMYLQEYHLALTFDCSAYIERLKADGEPLRIFMISAPIGGEKDAEISLVPMAACLSDDGSKISAKAWIESDEQLKESIKARDEYISKHRKYISAEFEEKWAKAKKELLGGATEAMDHYCAYRKKK